MPRPIGYYVHHQGAGHLNRARLIAGALARPCMLLGTFAPEGENMLVSLPDDRTSATFDGMDGVTSRPEALHYSPVGHAGVRARMAAIAAWISAADPVLMIVDVSVEVALFVRLLSVPVVFVRLSGCRDDQPHLEAFRAADALIAPFPALFESVTTPAWVIDKTTYVGFLAAQAGAPVAEHAVHEIAVVFGRGGTSISTACLAEAASATPHWTWQVYGDAVDVRSAIPANLHFNGWLGEIGMAIDRAAIVVGGAGDGLLAEVVARGKRFVCIPERRAFDEQIDKARVLEAHGLAVVLPQWPACLDWPRILDRAMMLDTGSLRALHNPDAVGTTVAAVETIAARFDT